MQAIKIKHPHHLAGHVLPQYHGRTQEVTLQNGQKVTVHDSDFVNMSMYANRDWMDSNPDMWEYVDVDNVYSN